MLLQTWAAIASGGAPEGGPVLQGRGSPPSSSSRPWWGQGLFTPKARRRACKWEQWHLVHTTAPSPVLEDVLQVLRLQEETPKGPKPALLEVTTTKTIPSFKLLCLKRKDISYPLLSVPGGKSVPCPVLGAYDGSNVSLNSSFFKKQSKNIFSKAFFSETWNTPVVF